MCIQPYQSKIPALCFASEKMLIHTYKVFFLLFIFPQRFVECWMSLDKVMHLRHPLAPLQTCMMDRDSPPAILLEIFFPCGVID